MIKTILQNYEIFLSGMLAGGICMSVLVTGMFLTWINYTAIPLDECG